ncbi:recombinase family protein, partial [bacterium]|nr:recombinase family protein [bacterium]
MANSKPAPVAYSYIRFSTREQRTGDSYRRQTAAAEAWAAGNKVRLDTSSYQDLGVSAYTGAHRENPDRHGLALFLRAIEERKIPKGAYLLVENLDRLTREHLRAALTLFLNILDAGVHLVSLSPEKVFRADATGDDVTMAGLFVEHFRRYNTLWNGERGRTWFYQNELPYDPPSQAAYMAGKTRGWAAYKVVDRVTDHQAIGMGIYANFTADPSIVVEHAVEAPKKPGVRFANITTISLGGGKGTI